MQIATFTAGSVRAGRKITREGEVFTLEGHGPLSAQEIMEYDEQGDLAWANDGTRAWVASLAQRASAEGGSFRSLQREIRTPPPDTRLRSRPLVRYGAWCLAGLVTGAVVLAIALAFGYPGIAPLVDLLIAASGLIFAASLHTGAYLGRPHVTYLDDNFSPLFSAGGALRLVLYSVSLIVSAFVTLFVGSG